MSATATKALTLYSHASEHLSHQVRLVLSEKGIDADIIIVDPSKYPEHLSDLNPYNSLPTIVDRELVLYDTATMLEYLEERFPHPSLLPVYPVERATQRQIMHRILRDWSPLVELRSRVEKGFEARRAEQLLLDNILELAPVLAEKPFFMSDELTLVDCSLAPILWRLAMIKVKLPSTAKAKPVMAYMARMFKRQAFIASLTSQEKSMRL